MLDFDVIEAAADLIDGKRGIQEQASGNGVCFPRIHQSNQSVEYGFEARETGETVLRGGVMDEGENGDEFAKVEPRSPAPLSFGLNRAQSETGYKPVSLVSCVRESQQPQGFDADLCGKHVCFQTFPTFPANEQHDAQREALIERAAIMEFDGGMSRADAEVASGLVLCGSSLASPIAGAKRREARLACGVAA